jgi:hypothetical protein
LSLSADEGREDAMDDESRHSQPDGHASSDSGPGAKQMRRPWVAPVLTRHASLTALTQQYPPNLVVDPRTGELLDPNNPEDRVRLADIPGSTGFFP